MTKETEKKIETVHELLSYIQKNLKAPKNQRNDFGKYNYRSCEDILQAVKPLANEYGGFVTCSDSIEMIGDRFYIKSTAALHFNGDVFNCHGYAREELSKKGMDGSQITGASSSYARKYALNGLFAIDDTKDADATNKHNDESNEPISKEQLKELSELFAKAQPDFNGFMQYFTTPNNKVEELKDLRASQYLSAKNMLAKKIQQAESKPVEGKTNDNT